MILSLNQFKSVTQGAVNITYENGNYYFYRMSKEEYNEDDRSIAEATAGIVLEFKTDASMLKLKVITKPCMDIRSFFAFDIFENDSLIGNIQNFKDENMTDNYSGKQYPMGDYSGDFKLTDGKKTVKIVLPHTLIAGIRELELCDATYIEPCKKDKILIAYGDSITQGYDAQHPSRTYAMQIADYLGAELYNKAIGGAVFEHHLVNSSGQKNADYVLVSYGTNDWTVYTPDIIRENAAKFIESVVTEYPDAVKFVITPIWRASYKEEKIGGTFEGIANIITDECAKYPDVKVIHGFNFVGHSPQYFGDGGLHPNDEGFNLYSKNLSDELNKLL